jgi:hypothetical protein
MKPLILTHNDFIIQSSADGYLLSCDNSEFTDVITQGLLTPKLITSLECLFEIEIQKLLNSWKSSKNIHADILKFLSSQNISFRTQIFPENLLRELSHYNSSEFDISDYNILKNHEQMVSDLIVFKKDCEELSSQYDIKLEEFPSYHDSDDCKFTGIVCSYYTPNSDQVFSVVKEKLVSGYRRYLINHTVFKIAQLCYDKLMVSYPMSPNCKLVEKWTEGVVDIDLVVELTYQNVCK